MKELTGVLLILMILGFAGHNTVWARGSGGHGSSIGGFSGGGGHFRGSSVGGSHFGSGHRSFGGSNHHFRGGHRYNRYNFGIGIGGFYGPGFYGPGFYGPGFYGYPYYYGFSSRYYYPRLYGYPSSVIAPTSPPVYIQREAPVAASTQPQTSYWYYCRSPEGYYPYVKQCPEGWLQVAPQPAPQ